MKSFWYSIRNCVDRFRSTKRPYTLLMSWIYTEPAFLLEATRELVVIIWIA